MQDLAGKHIVLGLTGGIACYKSAELCRLFVKAGATVQVVMTESAEQFMTPVTMQAVESSRGSPLHCAVVVVVVARWALPLRRDLPCRSVSPSQRASRSPIR